eukprot:445470_1
MAEPDNNGKNIAQHHTWLRLAITFTCIKIIHSLFDSLEFVESSNKTLFTNYLIVSSLWIVASISMYKISRKVVVFANIFMVLFVVSYYIGWNSVYEKFSKITRKFITRNGNVITDKIKYLSHLFYSNVISPITNGFTNIINSIYQYILDVSPDFATLWKNCLHLMNVIYNDVVAVYVVKPIQFAWYYISYFFGELIPHTCFAVATFLNQNIVHPISSGFLQFWDSCASILHHINTMLFDYILQPIGHFFQHLWQFIAESLYSMYQIIKHAINISVTWIGGEMSTIINTLAKYVFKPIADGGGQLSQFVSDLMYDVYEIMQQKFNVCATWIGDGISSTIDTLSTYVFNPIIELFASIGSYLVYAIVNVVQYIVHSLALIGEFVVNMYNVSISALSSVGNSLAQGVNYCYEITSLFVNKTFHYIFDPISPILTTAMKATYSWLYNGFSTVFTGIYVHVLMPLWITICNAFSLTSQYVIHFLTWVYEILISSFNSLANNILLPVSGYLDEKVWNSIQYISNTIINPIYSTVSYSFDSIATVLFNGFDWISQAAMVYYTKYCSEIILNQQNVYIDINNRYATILYSFEFDNLDEYDSQHLQFEIEIDSNAFVSSFIAKIDDNILHGETKEKSTARQEYDEAIQTDKNAVLLSTDHDANIVSIETNLKKSSKTQLNITVEQFVTKKFGEYELSLQMSNEYLSWNIISGFDATNYKINIYDQYEINKIDIISPVNIIYDSQHISNMNHIANYSVQSLYVDDWMRQNPQQFILRYKTATDEELLFDKNSKTFCHTFSYQNITNQNEIKSAARRVIFAVDKSGSMYNGNKWNQAINATIGSIQDLDLSRDRMGIVLFDANTYKFKHNMRTINSYMVNEAETFLLNQFESNKHGEGATNINLALLESIKMIKQDMIRNNTMHFVNQIIFVTDGQPTYGIIDTKSILENVGKENNNHNISIYGLGIGDDFGSDWVNDLNYPFIRSLSLQNDGFDGRIKQSETQNSLNEYYEILKSTLLSSINITYILNDNKSFIEQITNNFFSSLYEGTDILICGKINTSFSNINVNDLTISMNINATNYDGTNVIFNETFFLNDNHKSNHNYDKVERTWAYVKLLSFRDRLIKLGDANNKLKDEINKQATHIALKYEFVTQWTSMIVVDEKNDFIQIPQSKK